MMDTLLGFIAPWALFAFILVLQALLPARRVRGDVRDEITGELLVYRLNGLPVFLIVVSTWFVGAYLQWIPFDWLWQHRWSGLVGAMVLAAIAAAAALRGVPARERSWWREYYLGRRKNLRMLGGRVDAKMYLYVAGATVLELNLLSFGAHHLLSYPMDPSPGIILYIGLFTWFVLDYLLFEHVHVCTCDLFAQRLGFKRVWGCLAVYAYLYAIGLWVVADHANPGSSAGYLALSAFIFFVGWSLARGSSMQKYCFRHDPEQVFLGRIRPVSIATGEQRILCSGFWGLSRHVNYLGEMLMATGLTLALGWPWLVIPWLYPLYCVVLLGTRAKDDDRRCAQKYGELWHQYREKVPWRIVPYLY